ncbi:MAG: SRPBCC domain-containing protein [Parvularculaceae bacterium]
MTSAAIVSVRVNASPQEAFRAFTDDIGGWWLQNPLFALTPRGDGRLRFEPGNGGRLVTTLESGKEFEIGRISVWLPGERLVVGWRVASLAPGVATELEVRFEAAGDQTRVTVEHRAWDGVPQNHAARHGFPLEIFQRRLAEHWRALIASMGARLHQHKDNRGGAGKP